MHRKHIIAFISLVFGGGLIGFWIYQFIISLSGFFYTEYETHLSILLGVMCAYLFKKDMHILNKWLQFNQNLSLRLFTGIVLSLLTFTIATIVVFGLYILALSMPFAYENLDMEAIMSLSLILILLSIISNLLYLAYFSFTMYSQGQIDHIKTERHRIGLQLGALKNQLSPHFLFNSLNTISSLIYKDEVNAERFIRNLAKAYDYTLLSYDKKLVKLEEELQFVEAYQKLLETRFSDGLTVDINVDQQLLQSRIPPLTIQLLVENATKHNTISTDTPVKLEIQNDRNHIVITNNKTKTPKVIKSFKIGLSNIDKRYEILAGKNIKVMDLEQSFKVLLPILRFS